MAKVINPPFFSVVVPTYNRRDFIPVLLGDVLRQTFNDYELIVVDDGSNDGTSELFENFSNPKVKFFKISNCERGAARNFGVSNSKGRFINFFDSDDRMHPNHLITAFKELKTNLVPILRLDFFNLRSDGTVKECANLSNSAGDIFYENFFSINSIFLRRDIVEQYKFCEDRRLASSEDWELWIRLAARFDFRHISEPTSTVLIHEGRSLKTISPVKIMERDLFLIERLESDPVVMAAYGIRFRRFCADRYSFFMLGFASPKFYKLFLRYAFRAIAFWPAILFSRRYIAAAKNFILGIIFTK